VGTRREKTGIGWKETKEGEECAMWREKQCNRCSEMRQKERKERVTILSEDGREIRWLKETWKRRERIKKERCGG
jgi:hypothetical protein